MNSSNSISLHLHARPDLARLVRMTAANVAMLSSMTVDRVEDLRMAAEEAFVYACATGLEDAVRVEFSVSPEGLAMELGLGASPVVEDEREPTLVYAAFLLEATCDECVISDAPVRRMRLLKKIGGTDAER